jgi:protein TonB
LIHHNTRWFVIFSLAVHAAALTAWEQYQLEAGKSGQVLQLTVINSTAGIATATPASTDTQAHISAAEQPPLQTRQQPARQARVKPRAQTQAATATVEKAPAATAPAASSPAPGRQETDRHLRASVLELVSKQLKYPAIARRKGWQGIVQLELHIEPDGRISRLRIDKTSGYPVLDNAAAQTLRLASLPHARQWLNGQAVDLVVPVEYRLLDS